MNDDGRRQPMKSGSSSSVFKLLNLTFSSWCVQCTGYSSSAHCFPDSTGMYMASAVSMGKYYAMVSIVMCVLEC